MKRASYRDAINWIAYQDDTNWLGEENGVISVTACLVADIFGVNEERVTDDLRRALIKQGKRQNA